MQFSRKTDGEIGIPDFLFLPTGDEKKLKEEKHYRRQQFTRHIRYCLYAVQITEKCHARRVGKARKRTRLLRYVGREQYLQVYDDGRQSLRRRSDEIYHASILAEKHGRF